MAEMVHDSASGETEFWQARSATFNMLYQQLNSQQAKNIIKVSH